MTDFHPCARTIADSVSPLGIRLTTLEVSLHRFVLPEFNTHRALSRNSASSRAIPVHRMMEKVADHPAVPLVFAAEQKGMQGGQEISDPHKAREIWLAARDDAVTAADRLLDLGVHKSVVNRLLEPFLPHTVIVSGTDWTGFWEQRCSPLAQPEIRAAAECMQIAYEASTPAEVDFDQWHMPYIDDYDLAEYPYACRRISVARCARVSYLTHDGYRDPQADLDLFNRLVTAEPPHASPLEHVATPLREGETAPGNFTGWRQLRHLVLGF